MEQQRSTARAGLRFYHRILSHPDPAFPPTLFVSAAFQSMDSWSRFAHAFASYTTVVLADPPGIGRSDVLPSEYGIDFLAACLEQVLDEHGIERATLVAASYGTPIGYRFAQMCPHRLERLVLAGTMKEMTPRQRAVAESTLQPARARDRGALADTVVAGITCQDPSRPIASRGAALRILRSSILKASDEELAKYVANTRLLLRHAPMDVATRIRGPEVLVFTGEHDVFTTPGQCREMARGFERGWFTTIDHADHLFDLQRYDTVLELVLTFFQNELRSSGLSGCGTLERIRMPDSKPRGWQSACGPGSAQGGD